MEPETQTPRSAEEARPFEPSPAQLTGCGKPAVLGCLVLLVLLAAGLILMLTQSNRLLSWTMAQVKEQVMAELQPEVDPEARDRLAAAFDAASAALAAGEIDPEGLQALQRVVALVQASGGKLTPEQVAEVTRLLEEIGGAQQPETRLPAAAPG